MFISSQLQWERLSPRQQSRTLQNYGYNGFALNPLGGVNNGLTPFYNGLSSFYGDNNGLSPLYGVNNGQSPFYNGLSSFYGANNGLSPLYGVNNGQSPLDGVNGWNGLNYRNDLVYRK